MEIPTDAEIRALHRRLAPTPEAFESVHTHCEIVCALAEQVIERGRLAVDVALVRAGCLLHDIGVYALYDADGRRGPGGPAYVRHGVLGRDTLRDLGYAEPLCRFCSCHTGVGITREDIVRQGLPIPVDDYLAETPEEELVMYADKFHSKRTPPVFVAAASFRAGVARFGEDKARRFDALVARYGEPDLGALAAAYGHAVV